MKFQRTTLILVLLAFVVSGAVYLLEVRGRGEKQATETAALQIFGFKEADVQSFTVTVQDQRLEFVRTPATAQPEAKPTPNSSPAASPTASPTAASETPSPTPSAEAKPTPSAKPDPKSDKLVTKWQIKQPKPGPANDATVAYLLSLLTTSQRDRTLSVPVAQKAEFGLDKPKAIVEVTLTNQTVHRLILGNSDFSETGLYALIDPPAQSEPTLSVALLPMSFSTAIVRPLTEWQLQETKPSPSPLPTPSTPAN